MYTEKDERNMKKLQGNEEAKKKWENFWYYYKYHVLAGVFILVCIIVFAKDMLSKIDYDYCVSVVGSYAVPEEDKAALQKWFEEHGEDLNEDGEIHVQVADYFLPSEDDAGFDPQMYAASQTKLTVDLQEGTSMIYFLSEENYKRFLEMDAFPAEEETVKMQECNGFKEIGSPASMEEMVVTMRLMYDESKLGKDNDMQAYFEKSKALLDEFVGTTE